MDITMSGTTTTYELELTLFPQEKRTIENWAGVRHGDLTQERVRRFIQAAIEARLDINPDSS